MIPGQFGLRGRAEIGLFLAFRPALLLLLTIALMRRPAKLRWACYLSAILLASASEALLVHLLGAPSVLGPAFRALLASVALAVLFDLIALAAGQVRRWRGTALAALGGLAVIAVPGPIALYGRIALPAEAGEAGNKPPLMLLTGLPLVWGDGEVEEALRPSMAAPAFYPLLASAYAVRPIDAASAASLRGAPLLLVAQARPPGPAGLVAIDQWLRSGGSALILTDPALRWPGNRSPGDPRRPPSYDGLGPLLTHWGLALEPAREGHVLVTRDLEGWRVAMAAPGRFVASDAQCRAEHGGLVAECRIGRGRASLLADADLLHDLLWVGPGEIGSKRAGRLADNAAFVIARLDRLSGRVASGDGDRVRWISRPESFESAVFAAPAAPGTAVLIGLALLMRARRRSAGKDLYRLIHSRETGTK